MSTILVFLAGFNAASAVYHALDGRVWITLALGITSCACFIVGMSA